MVITIINDFKSEELDGIDLRNLDNTADQGFW